jgi:hypothetical protein
MLRRPPFYTPLIFFLHGVATDLTPQMPPLAVTLPISIPFNTINLLYSFLLNVTISFMGDIFTEQLYGDKIV